MKPYSPGQAVISPTPALRPKWLERNCLREGSKQAILNWVRERFELAKTTEIKLMEKVRYTVEQYSHHYTAIQFKHEGILSEIVVDKPVAFIRHYDVETAELSPRQATA